MEQLLAKLIHLQTNSSKPQFKAPRYSGESDIELFLTQFSDVANANNWQGQERTLHLRASLEAAAIDCGRGKDSLEIIENLRARYGISAKQARDKLGAMKKTPKQSLHELGSEIIKLMEIAYPRQDKQFVYETSVEIFSRSLNHKTLQQHLLARPHQTMAEAVRIAEEFLQIEGIKPSLAILEAEEEPVAKNPKIAPELQVMMEALQGLIQNQNQLMSQLVKTQNTSSIPKKPRGPCFDCGGPYLKIFCPQKPKEVKPTPVTTSIPGNEASPAQ
jgi:hypothetical protein